MFILLILMSLRFAASSSYQVLVSSSSSPGVLGQRRVCKHRPVPAAIAFATFSGSPADPAPDTGILSLDSAHSAGGAIWTCFKLCDKVRLCLALRLRMPLPGLSLRSLRLQIRQSPSVNKLVDHIVDVISRSSHDIMW